jgi:hypothetical protein
MLIPTRTGPMPVGVTVHVSVDGDGAHPAATTAVATRIGRPIMFRPVLDEGA